MLVTPLKDFATEFLMEQPGYHRGAGLHMSQIYSDLYQDLEPKRYQKDTPLDPLRVGAGLALEQMLEDGLRRRLQGERMGEIVSEEGIICSPDLVIFNGQTRVGEIKLTWLSCRGMPTEPSTNGFPPKFDKYFTQMMAYCHVLETPYARLLGYFVNGEYERARGGSPKLLAWDIEFSGRELADNWSMLINHARSKGML